MKHSSEHMIHGPLFLHDIASSRYLLYVNPQGTVNVPIPFSQCSWNVPWIVNCLLGFIEECAP